MEIRITWTTPDGDDEWSGTLPIIIGREGDLAIADEELSRRHARLTTEGGQLVLEDLGSSNGTFVEGTRTDRATLGASGIFTLGRIAFSVATVTPEADSPLTVQIDEDRTRMIAAPVLVTPPHLVVKWTNTETGASGEIRVPSPATIGSRGDNHVQLEDARVSRHHATLELDDTGSAITVRDEGSSNGTRRAGQAIDTATLGASGEIEIRPFMIWIAIEGVVAEPEGASERSQPLASPPAQDPREPISSARASAPEALGEATIAEVDPREDLSAAREDASIVFDAEPPRPVAVARDFPPPVFDQTIVPVDAIKRDGRPVLEADYVAIGGGLGSFVWVDMLRIGGVPEHSIAVLGLEPKPHSRYERLCINSQIPDHERLRSDSGSCPDCIWGWPGYAVREAWKGAFKGDLKSAGVAVWKIFNEPTFATTYTPKSGEVFASIDVEARRIGWDRMRKPARVRAIRKTDDGRYAIAYTVPTDDPDRERYALARFAHVAVGYPGIRLLGDLQAYRQDTGDTTRVVNAYEKHEHVYDSLRKDGGTVVLRGWGIVASRIIQTIWELRRDHGVDIQILHLTRSVVGSGNKYRGAQRETDNNWEFQPFNWPKACWGGDLRFLLEESGPKERAELLKAWGGTTTADREDWREIVVQGINENWYHIRQGVVDHVEPTPDGKVRTVVKGKSAILDEAELDADFILDCTGLISTIDSHPLLKDLVDTYNLGRNTQGRLDVAPDFEINGMRNAARGSGRLYASGVATLGGPYAPVDSFLGLQYSAQRSVDAMERSRAPGLRHLSAGRSLGQWLRWAKGQTPEGTRAGSPPGRRRAAKPPRPTNRRRPA